ncbi:MULTISPECIES: FAD-dependent oxidoreductase [Acetobacter]|mgnify:FL=1|uniref:D-amino-acid oxidase n=1 Tax=Acetobacter lovaniensis TaxID=104100 RepID=A0A841QDY1_9PROT|nr:FAD-dependent oxidoreductase [Acetobacter lovaniensis]MBB6456660.1 glycine/D-amino acid oxidase-like deaminating enzyme [Acetobacter lovaniensis]MCI1796412.1 FAD-binding oxidoreductase [Acetobacter lovaniensis]NHN81519.1 FAD-dependent oxidoreductase [Acetobacter lovaniensis]GBQ65417.1 D-amino acid oxidase [Acetobacter lovaniensis NRIC 0474]
MKRRDLFAASLAAGIMGSTRRVRAATPDASAALGRTALHGTIPRIVPVRAHADQIMDIKVCLRPFRPAGPRMDVEHVAGKTVVHNYGHGGSGWSLSWGAAYMAVGHAAATLERKVAVVGCGIIGLTSALTAQRAGLDVTIYTRDLLPHTRSVRANGSWTPDSRIALTQQAGPEFARTWEKMARYSWQTYRDYLGMPGNPIDFRDNYTLSDTAPDAADHVPVPADAAKGTFATTGMPQSSAEFAEYASRISDIIPAPELLAGADNPFPVAYARRTPLMIYNFGAYGHLLLEEFHQAGGRIVIREFHTPSDLADLPERVVINCPGYAARDWWNDKSLIPVRGQTSWLPPQPEAPYALEYKGAAMISKSDGVMIQGYDMYGLGEMDGVGNSFEHPDRAEAEKAIAIIGDLFTRFQLRDG